MLDAGKTRVVVETLFLKEAQRVRGVGGGYTRLCPCLLG